MNFGNLLNSVNQNLRSLIRRIEKTSYKLNNAVTAVDFFFLFVPLNSTLSFHAILPYIQSHTLPFSVYLTLPFPHITFSSHSTSTYHNPFTFILVSPRHPHPPHHLQSVPLCHSYASLPPFISTFIPQIHLSFLSFIIHSFHPNLILEC